MTTKDKREELFLSNARDKYGVEYDYSKVKYENNRRPVVIRCSIHGDFRVTPSNFLSRNIGCPHCGRDEAKNKRRNNYNKQTSSERCVTNQFNVNGYATKHPHLLHQLFK
ncbi:DUF723 domain-containing protein [Vibrio sp. CyArs1]|uniref:DUF723 domain-containing protein n=1 Tax=Vibrio sp. CyArs1 TaxID=2682577 RepID=UPI001F06EC1B|nr:DUF723 domain-containing protein [Vibrio sp. CyArs1]